MSEGYYPGIPAQQRRDPGLLPPYVEAALFLLCGMIIGGGATVLLLDRSIQRVVAEPDQLQTSLLERMETRLNLSESQRSEATEIVQKHFETLESLRTRVQPEVKLTMDALRDEIATVLNDSQREIWEVRFEELREKWQPGSLLPTEAKQSDTVAKGETAPSP